QLEKDCGRERRHGRVRGRKRRSRRERHRFGCAFRIWAKSGHADSGCSTESAVSGKRVGANQERRATTTDDSEIGAAKYRVDAIPQAALRRSSLWNGVRDGREHSEELDCGREEILRREFWRPAVAFVCGRAIRFRGGEEGDYGGLWDLGKGA